MLQQLFPKHQPYQRRFFSLQQIESLPCMNLCNSPPPLNYFILQFPSKRSLPPSSCKKTYPSELFFPHPAYQIPLFPLKLPLFHFKNPPYPPFLMEGFSIRPGNCNQLWPGNFFPTAISYAAMKAGLFFEPCTPFPHSPEFGLLILPFQRTN